MGFLTSYRVESPINQLYCQLLLNPAGKEATSSFQKLKKTNVHKEGELITFPLIVTIIWMDHT